MAIAEATGAAHPTPCNQPRSDPGIPSHRRRGLALWGCLSLTQRSPLVRLAVELRSGMAGAAQTASTGFCESRRGLVGVVTGTGA